MKIAVFGAGGVGGYYGAVLARSGEDVTFVARGDHLAAMRRSGIRVRSPAGDFSLPRVVASDRPEELGQADAVIVAVKSWQLDQAGRDMAPLLGPDTLVMPLQNGVDAHEWLAEQVGVEHVGKGLTRIISKVAAPGEIHHVGVEPYVAMAEVDGDRSPRVDQLVAAFQQAGVAAEVPEDIDAALWAKFLFVCSLGGVCAVCRAPMGIVRSQARSRGILAGAMEEIVDVARGRRVELAADVVARTMAMVDSFPAEGTVSLQRDIAGGVPSELEAWTGAAVRLGAAVGVPTPIHSFIYAALLPSELRARGEITFSAEEAGAVGAADEARDPAGDETSP